MPYSSLATYTYLPGYVPNALYNVEAVIWVSLCFCTYIAMYNICYVHIIKGTFHRFPFPTYIHNTVMITYMNIQVANHRWAKNHKKCGCVIRYFAVVCIQYLLFCY